MTLTDREKALVEAARDTMFNLNLSTPYARNLSKALEAYNSDDDNLMPTWEEFQQQNLRVGKDVAFVCYKSTPEGDGYLPINRHAYDLICKTANDTMRLKILRAVSADRRARAIASERRVDELNDELRRLQMNLKHDARKGG